MWDLGTGREALTLSGHRWPVTSLAFSPDGTRLAAGCRDNTVRLFDVAPHYGITCVTEDFALTARENRLMEGR